MKRLYLEIFSQPFRLNLALLSKLVNAFLQKRIRILRVRKLGESFGSGSKIEETPMSGGEIGICFLRRIDLDDAVRQASIDAHQALVQRSLFLLCELAQALRFRADGLKCQGAQALFDLRLHVAQHAQQIFEWRVFSVRFCRDRRRSFRRRGWLPDRADGRLNAGDSFQQVARIIEQMLKLPDGVLFCHE